MSDPQIIDPSSLYTRFQSGEKVCLIDVRTPAEYREAHVGFAESLPLDTLSPDVIKTQKSKCSTLYVICKTGSRARNACMKLIENGIENVAMLDGGTDAWMEAGLPVVRGKKTISMDRQVRLTVGIIVLAGSLLTAFVHPYFLGVPLFMGAGLIFSGITDFCGLALILGKCPWNR